MQDELANLSTPPGGWTADDPSADPSSATFDPAAPNGVIIPLDQQFRNVLTELDALRRELNALRRRDETVNCYLHRLDEELRLAARLQQDFLPHDLPSMGPLQVHSLFRPAGYVSGDLYDVVRLDENRLSFYLADAVGHGVPAALLTMFIKHALATHDTRQTPPAVLRPSEAISRLNDALVGQGLSQATFATALYGIIDTKTLQLTLSKAGHPSPIILRGDGRIETVEADGSLLGIFPGEQYAEATATLAPGDRVLIYTDGIEVAFSDDQINPERWRQELLSRRELPAGEFLQTLADRIDHENGSLSPRDDVTLLLIDVAR